jgi:hypothetical protein
MTADLEDCEYQPRSLWECHQLLTSPLGRDHILIKEVDRRNLMSYGDVIRGVGTECMREARLRTSLAIGKVRDFRSEINSRNAPILGVGLIRAILALETSTDDDGVPVEEEENNMTDIVADLMLEIQLKAGPSAIRNITDDILKSREILLYTKYKLLQSFRKAIVGLETRIETERSLRQAIEDNRCSTNTQNHSLVHVSPARSLASIKASFSEFVSSSLDRHLQHITTQEKMNPFTDQILLTELIGTKLALFKNSKNDLSIIESAVTPLSQFVIDYPNLDENFVRAYLQLLVVTPQVLVEIVADQELLFVVRKAVTKLVHRDELPENVKEIIALIQDCITPSPAPPQVSI